ncbi:MAG: ABC transporter substrate-binding protein [Armatimonadota bacterium]
MRRTLAVLLAVATAAALGAVPAAQAQAPPGILRIAIIGDVTLNPFTMPQQLPTTMVAKVVFSTLTRYRPGNLQPVGDLATSWIPADDGRVWVFKLKRGVKWHDGRPFTAADVKFTYENIVNPRVRALFRSTLRGLRQVDAIDDYTVRMEFADPYPSLPIVLAWNVPIAPRHLLEGKDLNDLSDFAQNPIGTGPFRFKEAVKGAHITVEANPDYHGGAPKLKTIVFKVLPEINTVVAQLRTGELDLAVVESLHKQALGGATHLGFKVLELPSAFYIALNNTKFPFNERLVRQAVMLGLNRELMVQRILRNDAPLATGAYAKSFGPFYNPSLKPYPFDASRAKQLLSEAGYRPGPDGVLAKDGRRLAFELMVDRGNPVREQIALFTQQSWKQLGADVKLTAEEWSVYIRRGNSLPGDYEARTAWRITPPDPDKTAEYTTGGVNNHYGYSNPEVDRMMAAARQTIDKQKRVGLYHKIQELIHQDVPVLWINYQTEILAVSRRVQGYPELGIRDALQWMHLLSIE